SCASLILLPSSLLCLLQTRRPQTPTLFPYTTLFRSALELAAQRIEKHHARQRPKDDIYADDIGVGLGSRWTAIDAVGLYVPGGTASYPSSVLMNAVPAKVAGVPRIVMRSEEHTSEL